MNSRMILPDMNGVVDPLSKAEVVQTRSGFAIYFDEDPAEASRSRVSFQHKTSRRKTSSGRAFYGIMIVVALAALVLGFLTGVIDLGKMTSGIPGGDAKWINDIDNFVHDPEYLPLIANCLVIFTVVLSISNFVFLLVQKFIGAISFIQTLAFSILILSVPACMFVIGIWAATI